MTALRAALGAVAGGLEGAQQAEALRRKQKLDEEAATRQSAKDALEATKEERLRQASLRSEERDLAKTGMIPSSQYTGLGPRDMPGATPRNSALRQVLGGKEYVLPESSSTVKHREGAMKMMGDRRALQASLAAGEKAGFDSDKLEAVFKAPPSVQGVLAARAFPAPSKPSPSSSSSKPLSGNEMQGILGMQRLAEQGGAPSQDFMERLGELYRADPEMLERPELAAYNVQQNIKKNAPKKPTAEEATRARLEEVKKQTTWEKENKKRSGESDEAYDARYQASKQGK
jgi:hypothetical protein